MLLRTEDCWLPLPGSWEETVIPFDGQFLSDQHTSVIYDEAHVDDAAEVRAEQKPKSRFAITM